MNSMQKRALALRDTDIQGAVHRCCENETLYIICMREFLKDKTFDELGAAINKCLWDDAFTAAHALKGLAGNLGFIPLMHATGQLVVLIRGGRINDVSAQMLELDSCYRDIIDAINEVLSIEDMQ